MFKSSRKRSIVGAAAAILIIAAGAAAYWTAGGGGTGSQTADTTEALVVNQVTSVTALYPGQAPQEISGTFDNGNPGPIHVDTLTAAITSVSGGAGACGVTDFTLTDASAAIAADVPSGDDQGAWDEVFIQFVNKATNQDGCKGATVHLSYTIS